MLVVKITLRYSQVLSGDKFTVMLVNRFIVMILHFILKSDMDVMLSLWSGKNKAELIHHEETTTYSMFIE